MSEEAKENNSLELELDGHVYLVEKDSSGNVVLRNELESETVLNALVAAIEKGLDLMAEQEDPNK
jgi:hypothetical protein